MSFINLNEILASYETSMVRDFLSIFVSDLPNAALL